MGFSMTYQFWGTLTMDLWKLPFFGAHQVPPPGTSNSVSSAPPGERRPSSRCSSSQGSVPGPAEREEIHDETNGEKVEKCGEIHRNQPDQPKTCHPLTTLQRVFDKTARRMLDKTLVCKTKLLVCQANLWYVRQNYGGSDKTCGVLDKTYDVFNTKFQDMSSMFNGSWHFHPSSSSLSLDIVAILSCYS